MQGSHFKWRLLRLQSGKKPSDITDLRNQLSMSPNNYPAAIVPLCDKRREKRLGNLKDIANKLQVPVEQLLSFSA